MNKTSGLLVGALVLRLALFNTFPFLPTFLDGRVECSTPVSSFKRLQEGLFQYSHGASPYHGVFHQSPLILALFSTINDLTSGEWAVNLLYSLVDVVTGYALAQTASKLSKSHSSSTVAAIYLFNPFTLIALLARSTALFSNATIALSLLAAVSNQPVQAMSMLALGSCLSMYPAYLAPALMLMSSSSRSPASIVKLTLAFLGSIAIFLGLSYSTCGNWDFVRSTYGTILLLGDLTPNIGMWWYFFTEMFAFFRPFFVGVFQIYVAIFSIPITMRFKHCPVFALATVWGIVTMFKSYPEVGDIGFYFTLLTLYKPIFKILKYPLPSSLVILYSSVLAPTFYHLWIYAGSGNSNFFYAITLVYALGMILIVSDTMWAAVRYDYDGGKNPNLSQI